MDTAWLEKFLTSPGNDGRAFSGVVDVRREGEVLFQSACGLASPRWGVPNTLDMRFDVASISKLFTSVAVLQLVAAGRLDLDASIHEYADLTSTAIAPAVTLRHLLTHTSGLADIAEEDEGENYAEVFRVVPCHTIVTLARLPAPVREQAATLRARQRVSLLQRRLRRRGDGRRARLGPGLPGIRRGRGARARRHDPLRLLRQALRHPRPRRGVRPDRRRTARTEHLRLSTPGRTRRWCVLHRRRPARLLRSASRAAVAARRPHRRTSSHPRSPAPTAGPRGQGFGLEFNDLGYYKEGESEGASGIFSHLSVWNADIVILSNTMDGTWPLLGEFVRRAREARGDNTRRAR